VTIFFSDIEESTALNERLGDVEWMKLLRGHNEIVRRVKARHAGTEIKTIGDAFMLTFRSALDGLRCAVAIQRALARRNEQEQEQIYVRIGLHTGEAVVQGGDLFGRHVNFAARVAASARGGEVVVSSLLRELAEPAREFRFKERKRQKLKGLRGTHTLHSVKW
jgi:class 3 adenylate cyclase